MLHKGSIAAFVGILSLGVAGKVGAQAALKYTGCADVTQANFTKVTVLDKSKDNSMDEVIRFGVSSDGSVYYAERAGSIKVLKPNGSVAKLGKIDVYPPTGPLKKTEKNAIVNNINNEFGLVGLALDRDFDNNHFIYTAYQAHNVDESRLSRFTVNGDAMDMASEKILLSWPIQKDYCCHTGGDIRMDAKGDLWMSVGNNTMNHADDHDAAAYVDESIANSEGNDQGHAANSNDLRGKILRVHPTADGKYTVPAGNFKDFYASMYTADELTKIKPEIYAMGDRNPYTIGVDDATGWVAWGEVGPDIGALTEEYNLITKPGFMGWPYFAGAVGNPNYSFKLNKDAAAPMNTSKDNTGVQKLPPAQGAIIGYQEACAITGPIYRWSAAQNSAKKLPGHFEGKWFVTDWLTSSGIKVITLNNTGTAVASNVTFFSGTWTSHPLELYVAPDGVLYELEYNSSYLFNGTGGTATMAAGSSPMKISRLEYTGAPCTPAVSLKDQVLAKQRFEKAGFLNLGLAGSRSLSIPLGANGVSLYELSGKLVWKESISSNTITHLEVPAAVSNGLYRAKFEF